MPTDTPNSDDTPNGDTPEFGFGTPEYPFESRVERDAAIRQWSIERVPVPEIARRAGVSVRRVGQIRTMQRARLSVQDRAELRAEIAAQSAFVTARMMDIVASPGAPIVKTVGSGEGSTLAYVTEPDDPSAVARDVSGPIQAAKVVVQTHRSMATLFGLDAPTKVETGGTVRYEIVGVDPEDLT